MLPVHFHIIAGLTALAFGYVALSVAKGSELHRKSGRVFAVAMVLMTATGGLVAVMRYQPLNIVAALVTFYLVATGWLTMRPQTATTRQWVRGLMALAVAVAIGGFAYGVDVVVNDKHRLLRAVFVFGAVAVLGAWGDWRYLARGAEGKRRLARHLWRMSLALWVATASLFFGQARVFPEALQNRALLATPVVLVLVGMLYWLGRVLLMPRSARA